MDLGFTSLLKEIAPPTDDRPTDYSAFESAAGLRDFLHAVPDADETSVWLSLDSQEADEEGFGTPILGVEVSMKAEVAARTAVNDAENKTLSAMVEWLADPGRAKIVHDPKLIQLLAALDSKGRSQTVSGIRHATMLYSYLLRPTTANHALPEVVLRHLNRTLSGAPGERADFLLRLAPILRAEVENRAFRAGIRND